MSLVRNERLKLTAKYFNGLAISFAAVGGAAPLAGYVYGLPGAANPPTLAIFAVAFLIASGLLQWAGIKVLGGLTA